jgi:hypothetical protein
VRRLLVVEDGTEYTEAFTRLDPEAEVIRAASLPAARAALASGVDALFLDVLFDRVPEEDLAGDLPAVVARFGGDRARAVRHLQENQGFYLLDALADAIPPHLPVLLSWDFASEPGRLESLRRKVPALRGLPDGSSLSQALALLAG